MAWALKRWVRCRSRPQGNTAVSPCAAAVYTQIAILLIVVIIAILLIVVIIAILLIVVILAILWHVEVHISLLAACGSERKCLEAAPRVISCCAARFFGVHLRPRLAYERQESLQTYCGLLSQRRNIYAQSVCNLSGCLAQRWNNNPQYLCKLSGCLVQHWRKHPCAQVSPHVRNTVKAHWVSMNRDSTGGFINPGYVPYECLCVCIICIYIYICIYICIYVYISNNNNDNNTTN